MNQARSSFSDQTNKLLKIIDQIEQRAWETGKQLKLSIIIYYPLLMYY